MAEYKWPEELVKKYGTLALNYIEQNMDLIDAQRFNELYSQIGDKNFTSNVTALLRDSEINPLDYMTEIPPCYMRYESKVYKFKIPDHIIKIGHNAFDSCDMIEELIIPISVNYIGRRCFYGTDSLPYITYKGTILQWEEIEKHPEWNQSNFVVRVKCTDGEVDY